MNLEEFNYIENRDCVRGLSELPDESIKLVITSPPNYEGEGNFRDYLGELRAVFYLCYEKLEEGRFIAINVANITLENGKRIPLNHYIINEMIDLGYNFKEDIIYEKSQGKAVDLEGIRHSINHEYILVFQKPGLKTKEYNTYESSVWKMSSVGEVSGITPFPVELSDKVVGRYSEEGDVVLDPYIGSGTTAISCIKLNRKYIGYEIDEGIYKISDKLIKNFKDRA